MGSLTIIWNLAVPPFADNPNLGELAFDAFKQRFDRRECLLVSVRERREGHGDHTLTARHLPALHVDQYVVRAGLTLVGVELRLGAAHGLGPRRPSRSGHDLVGGELLLFLDHRLNAAR